MSVISNNVLAGAAGQAGGAGAGYTIERSLRFNDDDTAYLNRTFATGNRNTWTWSSWVKISAKGNQYFFVTSDSGLSAAAYIYIASDQLIYWDRNQSSNGVILQTNRLFRDTSAWYHIVLSVDTTNTTSTDRVILYINGVRETSFNNTSYPNQNENSYVNSAVAHYIGGAPTYLDGYLAENHFIDGQALDETSFGEFDDYGVWQPKAYTGTYGTNGYYLDFSDNSSVSALGTDSSGNSNDWTTNNFSVASGAGNDSLIDTPTNYEASSGNNGGNYATLNPLVSGDAAITLSNGNLDFASTQNYRSVFSNFGMTSGKWYFEALVTALGSDAIIGISNVVDSAAFVGNTANSWGYEGVLGNTYTNNQAVNTNYDTFGANDLISCAFDADNGELYFAKNGTWQNSGDPANRTNPAFSNRNDGPYFFGITAGNTGTWVVNFGQRPFTYTPPTGFKPLCSTNLPDPTIADGSTAMDVSLYTGNGTSQTIKRTDGTSLGFSPDFVWIKQRDGTRFPVLYDTVRGATNSVHSNTSAVEYTDATTLTAFNTDGFDIGSQALVNENNKTYVGWSWDAGESNATLTAGSIDSTVRANPTAGFSVVKYTGDGTAGATIAHGLNAKPSFIAFKNLDTQVVWLCYHEALGATKYTQLSNNSAPLTETAAFNDTEPTSSVFSVGTGTGVNNSGDEHIAYCWTPVEGYSAFGEFEGNGANDNVFVYTGFRPRYVVWKRSDNTGNWAINDTERNPSNVIDTYILADTSAAETAFDSLDLVSNGFKVRSSAFANGSTWLWWAFAEHPFKTARAR